MLISTQFALYFAENLENPLEIYEEINSEIEQNLPEIPNVTPPPSENPQFDDFPIVRASHSDSQCQISIARRRLDFVIRGSEFDSSFSEVKDDLNDAAKKLSSILKKSVDLEWVGFLVNSFQDLEHPEERLAKVIDQGLINKIDGNNAGSQIKYTAHSDNILSGITINNILQMQAGTARSADDIGPVEGVLIQRDFNTRPGGDHDIDQGLIESLISNCSENLMLEDIVSEI